jgi:hypothetical protein
VRGHPRLDNRGLFYDINEVTPTSLRILPSGRITESSAEEPPENISIPHVWGHSAPRCLRGPYLGHCVKVNI